MFIGVLALIIAVGMIGSALTKISAAWKDLSQPLP